MNRNDLKICPRKSLEKACILYEWISSFSFKSLMSAETSHHYTCQQWQEQRWAIPTGPPLHKDAVPLALSLADISGTLWHLYFILLFSPETSMEIFIIFHFYKKETTRSMTLRLERVKASFEQISLTYTLATHLRTDLQCPCYFPSWVSPERRLASCQIVKEFGHMDLLFWGVRMRPPKVC